MADHVINFCVWFDRILNVFTFRVIYINYAIKIKWYMGLSKKKKSKKFQPGKKEKKIFKFFLQKNNFKDRK
jgi:hypothetical protein